jgi:lipopolysaccharide biosynthesis protein
VSNLPTLAALPGLPRQNDLSRLCLFAHYDVDGVIADHVRSYLEALGSCGFKIVVISTASLDMAARQGLTPDVIDVIVRENIGLDFGSWARGFNDWAHCCTGDLLLANDSVYAPIGDLAAAVSELSGNGADVRGMVLSQEFQPHLQSWFLLFSKRVWQHPDFRTFLNQPFGDLTKTEIILRGEVGLAEFMSRNGFSSYSAFPPQKDMLPPRIAANPTHFLWREIICDAGLPFIKVELLRDNPMKLPGISDWRMIVAEKAPAMLAPIERHLGRVRNHSAPHDQSVNLFAEMVRRDYRAARERKRFAQELNRIRFKLSGIRHRLLRLAAALYDRVEPMPVVGAAAKAARDFARRRRSS